jgi:integrase/recombinase XerC
MALKTISWESERRYKQVACQFAAWAKARYSIRQTADLRADMVQAYLDARQASNLSPRTIATELTALRRLDLYARDRGWIGESFIPKGLSVPHGSQPRYSYTPTHAKAIIAQVEKRHPLAAEVLRFQLAAGLRIGEAIGLDLEKVDFERGLVTVKGKGGRVRTVAVRDPSVLARLNRSRRFPLLHGKPRNWKRQVEALVRQACLDLGIEPLGTHAFRATAAQELFDEQREAGTSEQDSRRVVARYLGHNRTDVTHHYAP